MAFKKSDNNQIELVLSIIIAFMLIAMPAACMLQLFGVLEYQTMAIGEQIVTLCGGVMLIFIIMYMLKKENHYFTWLDLVLVLEAVSFVLSTIFSGDVSNSLGGNGFNYEGTLVNITYLLIIFSCSLMQNKKHRNIVWFALLAVALFESFEGYMQSVFKVGIFLGVPELMESIGYRAYGTIQNQNTYGALMGIFAGAAFGLLITSEKKKEYFIYAVLTVLFGSCVIFSGTRAAMVGVVFSALFWCVVLLIKHKKSQKLTNSAVRNYLIGILVIVVIIGLSYVAAKDTVSNTIDRVADDATSSSTGTVDALGSGRVGLWLQVLGEWENHPILGVGVDNLLIRTFYGLAMSVVNTAHNEYLDILVCRGLLGLTTYLIMMFYIFGSGIKRMWKSEGGSRKELFALLVAFVAYMATAMFGWRIVYMTPYFYAMCGLMVDRRSSKKIRIPKK